VKNTKLFVPKEAEKEGITNPLTLLMAQPITKPNKIFMIQKKAINSRTWRTTNENGKEGKRTSYLTEG